MNIAYKIIMIIVGCFVAYYIMSLATESKKLVQNMQTQDAGGKSINKVSGRIKSLEVDVQSIKGELKLAHKDISNIKNEEDKQEEDIKDIVNRIENDEERQNEEIQSAFEKIAKDEDAQEMAIEELKMTIRGLSNNDQNNEFVSVSEYSNEKKEDDAREDAIEKRLAEQGKMIEDLVKENADIKKNLSVKTEEIKNLKTELKVTSSISAVIEKNGDKGLIESLKAVLKNKGGSSSVAYEKLNKEFEEFKATTSEQIREMNKSLQVRIESLNDALKDSKALTAKTLQGIEKSMSNIEMSTTQTINETKQWINKEVTNISKSYKDGGIADIDINGAVQKVTNSLTVELEVLKREFDGLQKKIASLGAADDSEPVGIVVNKSFDKSLVMLNTPDGTFVFNPYADFTGVVRVRDGEGNEKMVLVPYTGEYLRIGENIIDTGPFSRSCAQGINCNIDVRGSMSAPVSK